MYKSGGFMKKICILIIVVLLSVFSVSASASWVGVQGLLWNSDSTITTSYGGSSSTASGKAKGVGIILAGAFYPSTDSSLGLGYQLGATSTNKVTVGGVTTSPDDPLTWRGGLTGQYRADLSPLLGIEIGAGLLFEHLKDSEVISGTTVTMKANTFNLLTSANLLVSVTESFSLVGGVSFVLPISASYKMTGEGISVEPDVDIEGHAFQAQLGVAFAL
jgi:hypothetical protein